MPKMPTPHPAAGTLFENPDAMVAKATALLDAGRSDDARIVLERVLRIDRSRFDALTLLGIAHAQLGRPEDGLRLIDLALRMAPDQAIGQNARGVCLFQLDRIEEAFESFDNATRLGLDAAYKNRGATLMYLGRYDEGLASSDKALLINPSDPEIYVHRVPALLSHRRYDEALASLDHAVALRPDYAEAWFYKARILLTRGDFDAGWDLFEWRWRMRQAQRSLRDFVEPLWLGTESIAGKSILLHAEQGFGDMLQFCRFAPIVANLGAKVILEVPSELHALAMSLGHGIEVVPREAAPPPCDFQCPLMSLPKALGLQPDKIPAPRSYLFAPVDRLAAWDVRLGPPARPRVGLVWFGSFSGGIANLKSMAFEEMGSLTDCGADFFSLQKQQPTQDASAFQRSDTIVDLGPELKDFADTAAAMSKLDLIITVDTAAAHLAGALGGPVWVLLSTQPEWRWPDGPSTPWYPTARLFRQSVPCDWRQPLAEVRMALEDWILNHRQVTDSSR
jgi:Flp pilus assembly protein TadD